MTRLRVRALALGIFTILAAGCGGGHDAPTPAPTPTPTPKPWPVSARPADVTTASPWGGEREEYVVELGYVEDQLLERTGGACLSGTALRIPADETLRRFERPFSAEELAWLVDQVPGTYDRVRDDGQEGDLAMGDPLSLVLAYGVIRTIGWERLDPATTAFTVDPASPQFAACRDAVVSAIRLGGAFYIAFRFEFASEAARQAFEAKVGTDVALWDLWPRLAAAEADLGGRVAYDGARIGQMGGDVTQIGAATGTAEDVAACWMGANARACAAVAAAAVDYATREAPGGFLGSLAEAPFRLSFEVTPWSELGAPVTPRSLPPAVALARENLQRRFEADHAIARRALVVESFFVGPGGASRLPALEALQAAAEKNVRVTRAALSACYTDQDQDLTAPGPAQAACVAGALLETLVARGYDPTVSYEALDLP
jgi:hypothetical protein